VFIGPVPRSRGLRIAAPLVAAEGVALVLYGVYILVQSLRLGITGPAEVSNLPAVGLEIVIFSGFGVVLLFTARGLWNTHRVARAPAVLAQIIAVVVGGPLALSTELTSRVSGAITVVVAVAAVIALLSPAVTEELG